MTDFGCGRVRPIAQELRQLTFIRSIFLNKNECTLEYEIAQIKKLNWLSNHLKTGFGFQSVTDYMIQVCYFLRMHAALSTY